VFPVEERPVAGPAPEKPRRLSRLEGCGQLGPKCEPKEQISRRLQPMCEFEPIKLRHPNAMYPILTNAVGAMSYNP